MEATIRGALGALEDVDDDVVEYLSSLLADGGNEADHGEAVREMLDSATDCGEAVADACALELFAALGGAAAADDDGADDVGECTAKLEKTVTMADGLEELRKQAKTFDQLETQELGLKSLRAQRKERQRDERRREEAAALERSVTYELERATAKTLDDDGDDDDDDGGAQGDLPLDCQLRNFDVGNKRGAGDVLTGCYVTLSAGRRYGLLGRNGCGKTTFLEWLAGRPRDGNSKGSKPLVPDRVSLLLVKQEIVGSECSAVETVVRSDARREGLKRAIAELEKPAHAKLASSLDALARCYEQLARRDELGRAPGPRARKVLHGLGFDDAKMDRPTGELSGGWRMRVSLACALFASPSLLLLDEPTNHLDLEATMWLERYLTKEFRGTLVVVSHDRSFLNTIVSDVLAFDKQKIKQYRGDVANFEAVREEDRARQQRQREVQEKKREGLQKYIDEHAKSGENGPKAAAQRKSKMKKMNRLGVEAAGEGKKYKLSYDAPAEEVDDVDEEEAVVLEFPDPGPFDRAIVRCQRASFSYDAPPDAPPPPPGARRHLLADVDLSVDAKSRICLLGRNGSGKSTLIKLLVGDLTPCDGDVTIEPGAKIEFLAQHQLEQLDPFGTPLSELRERDPGDGSNQHELVLRGHLAKFGLGGDRFPHQKIHTLSGGQKCRVCLAAAMYRRPHLLVLDEPTNHLDMETTDALIDAIKTFGGGVVVVSHDAHLCSSVCDQLWVVQDGAVARDGGTFKDYKREVVQGKR
ncbi:ATPase [Aureococcus anophagefferens]|nr:ATPase [Aureococcus anophagefferens]